MSLAGLVDVVHWIEDLFQRLQIRRSYGGALAYNYHGPPRLTQDVDVLVLLPDTKIPGLVEELARAGCLHGDIESKPIDLPAVLSDFRSKARMAVFVCRGVRVEVFVPWHPFHHRVLARSVEHDLEGRKILIHTAEDLIVFKKIFDRPKDLADIRAMLLAQKGRLNLQQILDESRALLTPESWDELDRLLREYGA